MMTVYELRALFEVVFPPAPEVLFKRAKKQMDVGNLDQAIAQYSRALTRPDLSAEEKGFFLLYRGICLDQQKEHERALWDYGELIEWPMSPTH